MNAKEYYPYVERVAEFLADFEGEPSTGEWDADENSEPGKAWAEEWSAEQKIAQEALLSSMTKRNATKADTPEIIKAAVQPKGDGAGAASGAKTDDDEFIAGFNSR